MSRVAHTTHSSQVEQHAITVPAELSVSARLGVAASGGGRHTRVDHRANLMTAAAVHYSKTVIVNQRGVHRQDFCAASAVRPMGPAGDGFSDLEVLVRTAPRVYVELILSGVRG